MIDLGNRWVADDGTVVLRQAALELMLYRGQSIAGLSAEPSEELELYHASNQLLDSQYAEPIAYDGQPCTYDRRWFTPEPWASIDVDQLLESRCKDEHELQRCRSEMQLFHQRQMIPVLRQLLYMIDRWRESSVVWGVGRGSSVSSFVLYLIGINRINPLRFGLDASEFFK